MPLGGFRQNRLGLKIAQLPTSHRMRSDRRASWKESDNPGYLMQENRHD
jgi:hypothetical protein